MSCDNWTRNPSPTESGYIVLTAKLIPNSAFRIPNYKNVLCLSKANTGHYRSNNQKTKNRMQLNLLADNNSDNVYNKSHNKQHDNNDLSKLTQSLLSGCTAALVEKV